MPDLWRSLRGADGLVGRRLGRRRGARVLELLLGAEQRVEDLLAEPSLATRAMPAPTMPSRRIRPLRLFLFFCPRSESAASFRDVAASFSSR